VFLVSLTHRHFKVVQCIVPPWLVLRRFLVALHRSIQVALIDVGWDGNDVCWANRLEMRHGKRERVGDRRLKKVGRERETNV
jgi:hypothetical protein